MFDYSKLPTLSESGKFALSALESAVQANLDAAKGQAGAIADSIRTTGKIATEAIADVLAGKIDVIAAERIARRTIDQSIDLAKAGANLSAVVSLNTLRDFALSLIRLAPRLLAGG